MKKLYILIVSAAISLSVFAQQDLMVSQYTFNHTFINPAATGITEQYNASLMYRNQWVRFEGAPVSQFLAADGPILSKNMGVGLLLQRETIGVNTQTEIYANYAYNMMFGVIKLSMGLRAGMSIFEANYQDHRAIDENDIMLQENTLSYLPNVGFGIYLKHDKYFASFSIPHILSYAPSSSIKLSVENSNQLVRHYYLMGGYTFTINNDFTIEPSVLGKYLPDAPAQLDINTLVEYKKIVSLGFGYRTDNSIIALMRVRIYDKFQLGYAFDFTTSDIKSYSSGTHEIMLNYRFGKSKSSSSLLN